MQKEVVSQYLLRAGGNGGIRFEFFCSKKKMNSELKNKWERRCEGMPAPWPESIYFFETNMDRSKVKKLLENLGFSAVFGEFVVG